MSNSPKPLRPTQPHDAPDAPGKPFSAWDYGHALARSGTAGKVGTGPYVVLHAIASHADKQATCQLGHQRIADETGLSVSLVKHHIKTLEACGALMVARHKDEQTQVNSTNRYHIEPIEQIRPAPSVQERKVAASTRGKEQKDERGRVVTAPSGVNTAPTGVDTAPSRVDTAPQSYGSNNYRVGSSIVPMVPRSDSTTRGDQSARNARAREDSPEELLDTDALRPPSDWVLEMALCIYEHWGGDPSAGIPAEWCNVLWKHLADCTVAQRKDFLSYLFSGNDVLRTLNSPRGVQKVMDEDAERWKARGMPDNKNTPAAPKVPAHIQWEHDHAHNPQRPSPARCVHCKRCIEHGEDHARDCPTEVRRLADQLRKVGRNKDADDYLRKHGLLRESHATG